VALLAANLLPLFEGGAITPDAAALSRRHTEKACGLCECIAACFIDNLQLTLTVRCARTLAALRTTAAFGVRFSARPKVLIITCTLLLLFAVLLAGALLGYLPL